MGIFGNIDFNNLPVSFNEADVREEIIKPLLNVLGYSFGNERAKIEREVGLKNPNANSGTRRYEVIKADYVLSIDGKAVFTLEAKSPGKEIVKGEYVSQARSYASHPEVLAPRFALCNGKLLTVFDTSSEKLLLRVDFAAAGEREWGDVYETLSPDAFEHPNLFKYKADFGIWCKNCGLTATEQYFYDLYPLDVAMQSKDNYTITATIVREGTEYLASFDFGSGIYDDLIVKIEDAEKRKRVTHALSNAPFQYITEKAEDSFPLSFCAKLSKQSQMDKNGNEEFIPLDIIRFM